MTQLRQILDAVSAALWGPWLLIPLLLGTGLFLTIRLGGIQVRLFTTAMSLAFGRRRKATGDRGEISSYQAMATALAVTVGTGNIVGVATAIWIGGPGALFWMWTTALLGMASKYAECFLGVRFRTRDEAGELTGGPQVYLVRGIRSIAKVTGLMVPLMIVLYIAAGLYIIGVNAEGIPEAFSLTLRGRVHRHGRHGRLRGRLSDAGGADGRRPLAVLQRVRHGHRVHRGLLGRLGGAPGPGAQRAAVRAVPPRVVPVCSFHGARVPEAGATPEPGTAPAPGPGHFRSGNRRYHPEILGW